jgi:hypothetical protein
MTGFFQFVCGGVFGGVIGIGVWAVSGFGGSAVAGGIIVGGIAFLSGISSAVFKDRFWSVSGDKCWWKFF